MGEHAKEFHEGLEERNAFLEQLLNDLKALEFMLNNGMIEKGIQRIGAEQEFCIIDRNYGPSLKGPEILKDINHEQFTTELARFNLEINLNPYRFKAKCFSKLEKELRALLDLAHEKAHKHGSKVLLTGILPSISLNELSLNYMTPNPRYFKLGEVIREIRGSDFELHIQGIDDLIIRHDNILFEACNTSFQVHLQVDPDEFVDAFNWAQAISGPILALCTNSPLLFGRELWAETRIALFEQSIDTRDKDSGIRERQSRVSFGKDWIRNSIMDIYKDDISRFPLLLSTEVPNSMQELSEGKTPKLRALSMHNGTIWKWNRPCYGVGGGKAHLRIENRYIPSGPSVSDEIANAALWIGVMNGMPDAYKELWKTLDFEEARENFHKAAKSGMEVLLSWNNTCYRADEFARDCLLPWAREGLSKARVNQEDIEHYLGIIEKRISKGITASRWTIKNYRKLKKRLAKERVLAALTKALYDRSTSGQALTDWRDVELTECKSMFSELRVHHVMTSELFTVREDDLIGLLEHIMKWRKIRHVPVENHQGNLIGLVTAKVLSDFRNEKGQGTKTVSGYMRTKLKSIGPEASIKEAMDMMLREKIGCLPVLRKNKLIGIITDTDMKRIWMEEKG